MNTNTEKFCIRIREYSNTDVFVPPLLQTQHFYPSDESILRAKQIKTSTALTVSYNLLYPGSSTSPLPNNTSPLSPLGKLSYVRLDYSNEFPISTAHTLILTLQT